MSFKTFYAFLLAMCLAQPRAFAQPDSRIYRSNVKVDLPVTLVAGGLTGLGFYLQSQKSRIPEEEVLALDNNDINGFDRWATRYYSDEFNNASDIPFYAAFGYGAVLLLDEKARNEGANLALMYFEALTLSSATYAMTSGTIDRYRPYVYNSDAPMSERTSRHARNSFMSGHPMPVTTSTVFVAKVYSDLHPESNFKYVLWGVSATASLGTAYMRLQAGKHYPSDLITGLAFSSAIGYLVPHLHKKDRRGKKLSVMPFSGDAHGLAFRLKL